MMDEIDRKLESIDIPRVQATSAVLKALAFMLESRCSEVSNEFMKCKKDKQPEKCVEAGRKVTDCFNGLFKEVRKECQTTFEKYYKCLEMNNHNFIFCRDEEMDFNQCSKKLGVEKKLWKSNGPHEVKDSLDIEKQYFQFRYYVYRNKNK